MVVADAGQVDSRSAESMYRVTSACGSGGRAA